jgi:hypothetical protein
VRRLLAERVQSLDRLEALLLLRARPAPSWSPEELCVRLKVPVDMVAETVELLANAGLAEKDQVGRGWVYKPSELDASVDALATAWNEQPVEVLRELNRNSLSRVRDFADAFLVRRKKDG